MLFVVVGGNFWWILLTGFVMAIVVVRCRNTKPLPKAPLDRSPERTLREQTQILTKLFNNTKFFT